MTNYILNSRGEDYFHFRVQPHQVVESFSVTYCHDGTVCMTGDMGCLAWRREYFPKTPDYGFPFAETSIDYFAEKVVRAEEMQKTRGWDAERARRDIIDAICEERCADDTLALMDIVEHLDDGFEPGERGYGQMIEAFNERAWKHSIESEEYCEFGIGYTSSFLRRFEMIRSVSNLILSAVSGGEP